VAADDFDFRRARRVLERIPGEVNRELKGALKLSGEALVAGMFDRFTGYSNPRTAGDRLQSRNGDGLRSSFSYDVSGDFGAAGQPLTLLAFSAGKRYARIQEFGGEVRPTGGRRYLTIPVADNLTPGGRVRWPSAADLNETYPDLTYIVPGKNGNLLLFAKSKPGAKPPKSKKPPKPLLLFVLTRKVTIPPRLGFRKTWDGLAPKRVELIRQAVQNAAKAAQAGAE